MKSSVIFLDLDQFFCLFTKKSRTGEEALWEGAFSQMKRVGSGASVIAATEQPDGIPLPFHNCQLVVSQKDWGFIWRFNELQSAGCVCVRSDRELSTDHQKKKRLVTGFCQVVLSV